MQNCELEKLHLPHLVKNPKHGAHLTSTTFLDAGPEVFKISSAMQGVATLDLAPVLKLTNT